DPSCEIADKVCNVKGSYSAKGKFGHNELLWNGNWLVEFEFKDEYGCWYIMNVQIKGIEF
ncbi:MAG TPA: hypothetical protein VN958_15875, partial [Chitinophagaceae bacterium]|nr:hypothetical protein [Chitinophagaceae bacterium]